MFLKKKHVYFNNPIKTLKKYPKKKNKQINEIPHIFTLHCMLFQINKTNCSGNRFRNRIHKIKFNQSGTLLPYP